MKNEISGKIDHTFLKAAGDRSAVRKLCQEAKRFGFASVCVNPAEVRAAAGLLKGSSVKVCTVIGFPLGASTTRVKSFECLDAIENGAEELDVVVNVRALKYDPAKCLAELKDIAHSARRMRPEVVLKLILECCYLTDAEKRRGCRFALEAGFDFVKTSTGFGTGGATVADVKLMKAAVKGRLRVKAAGGIRDRETALAMISAGADRLGTSAGVKLLG